MGQQGHSYDCVDLVITTAGSANLSNVCPADPHYKNCDSLMLQDLNASLTGTCTVVVSYDGTTYDVLQSGGSDVAVAAGKVTTIDYGGWLGMKISSDGTEAGERTWAVRATETIG